MASLDARHDPEECAAHLLKQLRDLDAPAGASVGIVDYETSEDFEFLNPGVSWTHADHQRVLAIVKAALLEGGYLPAVRRVDMSGYFAWIAATGRAASPTSRAEYINKSGAVSF